ncbi:helix-turn-helix transcriptional regulator [Nocardioides sp. T2.26MG-1]|uniref:helix-turn-helix transcriptional regulator n=1 Tax=Nocardioides sp. T2.26MG-1 TaxID=3041166 RepID=UPI0024773B15|nr:LuxR C-terminal-related transcriptional regulator [Nocardioides sp. T2.26MG-1]CAI9398580.1 putative transcriptional regulatory protein NarL [Nocardioides sp. T2.26MG-1]
MRVPLEDESTRPVRAQCDGGTRGEVDVTATRGPRRPLRIAVGSDELLLSQAVRAALAARGFVTHTVQWRSAVPDDRPALQLSRLRPDAGLMLCRDDLSPTLAQVLWLFVQHPVRWVVVTSDGPGPAWGALLEAGAGAVMSSERTLDEVVEAIIVVAHGDRLVDSTTEAGVIALWHAVARERREALARLRTLTPREHAVLELLVDGQSIRAIAASSDLAEATVRSQVRSVLHKLGVGSQLRAAAAVRTLCGRLP